MTVSMPFYQWGAGRADVQAARAEETRIEASARARRDAIQEDARFAALQLTQAQRMLAISAKADTVATKRFEVAKNRYVIGKIGISDLYIAQTEKDQALQAYVQALRGYWTAYYRLRRLTLYDFAERKEIRE
jgi:outer membrane protein TolC